MGGRIDHIERKMGEFVSSHNTLVDAHDDQAEEIARLKAKMADLEDASRRNNLKLRGVPEAMLPAQLQDYARDLHESASSLGA